MVSKGPCPSGALLVLRGLGNAAAPEQPQLEFQGNINSLKKIRSDYPRSVAFASSGKRFQGGLLKIVA